MTPTGTTISTLSVIEAKSGGSSRARARSEVVDLWWHCKFIALGIQR
jgi:hypothetical protein